MLLKKMLVSGGLAMGLLAALSIVFFAQAGNDKPAYLDPTRTVEERVNDLIGRMTLKEKIGQLNLPCVYVDDLGKTIPEKREACKRFAAGTYTNEIGPGCGFFTLANEVMR